MQIHELPAQTTAADADVLAIDDGSSAQKITVENLGKKVSEDATPAFASGDAASPTEWSDVSVVTSGTALKTILNRVTTMMKNVRWLYSKLGTTDISSIADGTLTGIIGTTNISGIGGGTVTGAISKLNTETYFKITTTQASSAVSIPANTASPVTINVAETGYKILGVVGYDVQYSTCWAVNYSVSGDNVIIWIRNNGSSAVSAKPTVHVLKQRTS